MTLFLLYYPRPTSSGIQTSCCLDCLAALVPEFTINHFIMQIAKLGVPSKKLSRAGVLSQTEGGWPFAIQFFFFKIYRLTKFVLDLPNIISASKKNTCFLIIVLPFSRISWHRPTMGCSAAAAPCCSFLKTEMDEN